MMKRQELAKALAGMGLKKNDIVLLHSALSSLGQVEGGADGVIDAFMQVLGKGGTLIVPVFGKLGVITERLKERPDAVVSNVPVGTLAAIGGRAKELLADHWEAETAHGEGTPFLKIARAGGYVCLLGVDQDRNTMLHSAEALLELPYLGSTTQTCTNPKGRTVTRTWRFYPGPHRNFIGLDRLFAECGAMTVARIGNAQVRLLKAKEMLAVAMEVGGADPAFALCDNPDMAFMATDSKVASVTVIGGSPVYREINWKPDNKNEVITGIKFYTQGWYGTHGFDYNTYTFPLATNRMQIMIFTYNETTGEGKIYLRPFNVSTGLFTFKDNGVYGGFGRITAVASTFR